jgi:hypothetical protein
MARSTAAPTRLTVPTQIQSGAIGTTNPAVVTGRSVPLPSLASRGPSQQRERFAGLDLPPGIARALQSMQDAIARAIAIVRAIPFASGNMIQGVQFSVGTMIALPHGLGRPWRGYMVVNVSGAGYGTFRQIPQARADLETNAIGLVSSATCVADVWVW